MFNRYTLVLFVFTALCTETANVSYGRFIGLWADGTLETDEAIFICGLLTVAILILYCSKNVQFICYVLRGNTKIHHKMINNVVRSPLKFFDTNPVGRVLNRFATDLGVMDRMLLLSNFELVEGAFFFAGIFITVWTINPIVLAPAIIAFFCYKEALKFYSKAIKTSKGLELITRSPIYSELATTLPGLVIIRAYN